MPSLTEFESACLPWREQVKRGPRRESAVPCLKGAFAPFFRGETGKYEVAQHLKGVVGGSVLVPDRLDVSRDEGKTVRCTLYFINKVRVVPSLPWTSLLCSGRWQRLG